MVLGASDLILLNDEPIENAKRLSQIVPSVELMLDGDAWDDADGAWERLAGKLAEPAWEFTVHPPAWDHNVAAGLHSLRHTAQELNKKALELAVRVGAKQMVFHTGYCDRNSRFSRELAQRRSMEALQELIELAKPHGITLGVENVSTPQNSLYTQEEYVHILDGVDDTAQYLLDLGHAHMNGWDIPWVLENIGPRLCGLHIHDNNGRGDQHLPIFQGSIPWGKVFAVMDTLRDDCHFILEYAPGTALDDLRQGADILRSRFTAREL